jgi:hypothetical protein
MACPAIGSADDADSIWGFAFGRNTYEDDGLGRILQSLGAQTDEDRLVFARLKDRGFKPGCPNRRLAGIITGLVQRQELPVYAQWEVVYAMWDRFPATYDRHKPLIHAMWPPPAKPYYNSWDLMEDIIALPEGSGMQRPLILGQANHLARIVAIAWEKGLTPITSPVGVREMDKSSVQPHTRRLMGHPLKCWVPRESAARAFSMATKRVRLTPPAA